MAVAPNAAIAEPPALSLANTIDSMRAFARAGLAETTTGLTNLECGGPRLKEMKETFGIDEAMIGSELNVGKLKKATNRRFLPLPVLKTATSNRKAFYLSFFRPRFRPANTPDQCDFELMLVCKDRKSTIGFGFERGRRAKDTHGYTHVQLRHEFSDCPVETSLGSAYEHSYPAWPTRCRQIGDVWLAVLVTLYGLSPDDGAGLGKIIARVREGGELTVGPQMLDRARHLFEVPKAGAP
jgi:hypothetical protein